jgi:hypothetical protein
MLGIQFLTMTANQSKLRVQTWNESMVEADGQKLLVAANESENADVCMPLDYKYVALALDLVMCFTHTRVDVCMPLDYKYVALALDLVMCFTHTRVDYTILPTLSIPPSP